MAEYENVAVIGVDIDVCYKKPNKKATCEGGYFCRIGGDGGN